MNEQEVKDLIESFIVTNGVNAITADVLRPILIAMLIQPNEAIGDLDTLNTVTQDNLVDAINEIYNAVNNIVNDGIKLYQGDSDPNVEPPDSYDIADFYFEEGTQLWQFNGFEWIKVNYGDSINLPFKGRFDYIDSPIFSLPTGVKALDVRFNGTGSDINWNQLGNNVKYNGTIGMGDYLIIIGLYSNVPIGTIPSLEMVTSQGSRTLVTIQSPDAVNADDLVPLGQVEQMIEDFPAENTNIANTDFTFTVNRTHNLNAKKLKFTNGDFEVPAVTLTETSENTKPNKIGTADGLIVKWTNKLGIQRVFAFMSDVLDKVTTTPQSVAGKVTFNGTLVHNPPTTPLIKAVLVLNELNELKQSTAVELMADDGSLIKYNNESELDAIFPTAVSGFELLCPNISTPNFPNGLIYKRTNSGWRVEKLYTLADV